MGFSEALARAGEGKCGSAWRCGRKREPTAWVLGRGRRGEAEGVGKGGASAHVLVGDRGTMEPLVIVQDPSPLTPPPASQRVPSAGWIRVVAWGRGGGP